MSEVVGTRLSPIKWLAETYDLPANLSAVHADESTAKRLHETYDLPPTIGCEIEVRRSTLYPEVVERYFGQPDEFGRYALGYSDLSPEAQKELDAECAVFDDVLKPQYKATQANGIPAGNDAYWEFAHEPTYSWRTLATETDLLFKSGLIPEGYDHSLHVTLGGIAQKGGGPCLILSGLELMNVPPERILSATVPNKYGAHTSWARRGTDGLRTRNSGELQLNQVEATEMRTLTAQTAQDTVETLRTAQVLATVLKAYRVRHETPENTVQSIAGLWPGFRSLMRTLWERRGLPIESWGSPHRNPGPWRGWAECLARREDTNSLEHETIADIHKVVAKAEEYIATLR